MTLDQLKVRCEALAAVGDEQARCTLAYLFAEGRAEGEVVALREKNQKLAEANLMLGNEVEKLKWEGRTVDEFTGAHINGQVVYGVEPRPRAQVPPPRKSADAHLREGKSEEGASVEEAKSVNALAREYGIPEDGPEAMAIAATRAAHGLPATTDPLAAAANPGMKTGGFEKVPGADKDGNKE